MWYNGCMRTNKIKTAKQLERHFKGVANHRRIAKEKELKDATVNDLKAAVTEFKQTYH